MSTSEPLSGQQPRGAVAVPIVVIDDHELFSTSLLLALHKAGLSASWVPVQEVTDLLTGGFSGLVLLDLDLGLAPSGGPRLNGADLVAELTQRGCIVLILTGSEDQAMIAAAISHGARGVIDKSSGFATLLAAVLTCANGESLLTEVERDAWNELHESYTSERIERTARVAKLTPRERDVLDLLAEGHRAAAIADNFVVSISTVRAQIRSILSKTNSNSQLEAVALIRPRPVDKQP